MTSIGIIGGRGWLGSAVKRRFLQSNQYRLLDLVRVDGVRGPSDVSLNLEDAEAIARCIEDHDLQCVLNAAGRQSGNAHAMFADNAALPAVIAEAIVDLGRKTHLVHFGSAAEYGVRERGDLCSEDDVCRPAGLYGLSKLAGSEALSLATKRGLNLTNLRIFNPISSSPSNAQVLGAFLERARARHPGEEIAMGRLDGIRDFIALECVVDFVAHVVDGQQAAGLVNVCSGRGRRVRDLIGTVAEHAGLRFSEPPGSADSPNSVIGCNERYLELGGRSSHERIDLALKRAGEDLARQRSWSESPLHAARTE